MKMPPNKELSVLYGEPTFNMRDNSPCIFPIWSPVFSPYVFSHNMTRDLAHLQLSDLQGEIRPICRTSDL